MDSIALILSDGTAFFVGLGTLVVSAILGLFWKTGVRLSLVNICCCVSLLVVVSSATPLPLWEYVSLGIFTAGFLLFTNGFHVKRLRTASFIGIAAFSCLMAVQELPYRSRPIFKIARTTQVYVIGDSISAGISVGVGNDNSLWPSELSRRTGLHIINLAQAGATAESANEQISDIPNVPSVVILEIGGNDLLGGSTSKQFRMGLDRILKQLHENHHRLLMFELPLFPLKNEYGKVQRDLAKQYGVTLIPKRYFAKILGTEGATSDGLHLSTSGQSLFANMVARILVIKNEP